MENLPILEQDYAALARQAIELLIGYVPQLILALLTLVIGLWLINRVASLMGRALERRRIEPSLERFLTRLSGIALKILLLISVAAMIGVETTSFIAILGAAGLAVGLALQGSLANFAGGVLLLALKPLRVGEIIEAQGTLGTVEDINIFQTMVKTFDNRQVIIPNGELSNGRIVNMSREAIRRAEWQFSVSYEDDIREVRALLERLIAANDALLQAPEPAVWLTEFADSAVVFTVRAWVAADDLWPVTWAFNETVKLAFDEADITIPYPQRDIHLQSKPA